MPNNDPTHPDQATVELTPLGDPAPAPTPGLDDWRAVSADLVAMLNQGSGNRRQLWVASHQWTGLSEVERLDILQQLLDRAKAQAAAPSKGRDRIDSTRFLDICSDLWHALDFNRDQHH